MRIISAGEKFGKLLIVGRDTASLSPRMWVCTCECGVKKSVRADHLRSGRTISCGCHKVACLTARLTTHGRTRTRVYRIWRCMLNRCHYEKYPEWHLYGGRGIEVCQRWRDSFEAFFEDMGEPADHLSIDRIDGSRNYEPGNCRWATAKEQANNRCKPSR